MPTKTIHYASVALMGIIAGPAMADEKLGLPTAEPESVGMSTENLAVIPQRLGRYLEKGQLPGFVTVVARQGKIVHFEAFGKRDVERDLAMEKDTIFRLYSMTKPVTAAAIMMLVDEGKLDVSDHVAKYIPEYAEMQVLEVAEDGTTTLVPAKSPITIKHLLMHTSGMIYGDFDQGPLGKIYDEHGIRDDNSSEQSLEEFARAVARLPLKDHPGTAWHYGISTDVLGRVVEVVSGERFSEYLRGGLFEPLKMHDAAFYVPREKVNRFAANYGPKDGGMVLIDDPTTSDFLKPPRFDSGGGGMVGTATDYLRFAQMLVNAGQLDGVRILSEESVREMTTDHLGAEFGTTPLRSLGPYPLRGVGFGYAGAVPQQGVKFSIFGAEGEYTWGGYASTDFWIDPAEKLVGIVLTQLIPTGTYPQRIVMRAATYAAISESYKPAGAGTDPR